MADVSPSPRIHSTRLRPLLGLLGVTVAVAAASYVPLTATHDDSTTSAPAKRPSTGGLAHELKRTLSVEELNRTAEQYFASGKNWDFWLSKPIANVEDAPALLNNFAQLLVGLQLVPGVTVVDFGAGSGWASRWLTQLGMEVVSLDVSPTALRIGRELYARQPVFGNKPAPRFLLFDGHHIDLPDASVDRIFCFDTFHHVVNQQEVLREMSRILAPGGIAGFSEPGPRHSESAQSSYEMRNFRVLEDDVNIGDIWSLAKRSGFADMKVAVFSARPSLLSLTEFEDYLNGGAPGVSVAETTRAQMQDRRLFFLVNAGQPALPDSRSRSAFSARIKAELASKAVAAGAPVTARVVVSNTSRAVWLPRTAKLGAVMLAWRLVDATVEVADRSFSREPLTPGAGRPIAPGETVELDLHLPLLPAGRYVLELDLVSESVGYFSQFGSGATRAELQVIPPAPGG